ncbi:MAG: pyridoxamine 5'-phosphate oxidase family protein [Acidimicrobiales bacterium]
MSGQPLGPGPRTKVRRLPAKASYDADVVFSIIDRARFCHVAGLVDGMAMALPTLHVREGRTLYLHGSRSNAIMNAVLDAGRACVSVMIYDGLRLARSGFESSIAYRSVVVVGTTAEVRDPAEKARVLDLFVDAVLPGRAREVRPLSDQEARLTLVVRLSIDEASAKISQGPTDDDVEDQALPIWSGTVPAHLRFDDPVPSADGAMATGDIALPESVRRLLEER